MFDFSYFGREIWDKRVKQNNLYRFFMKWVSEPIDVILDLIKKAYNSLVDIYKFLFYARSPEYGQLRRFQWNYEVFANDVVFVVMGSSPFEWVSIRCILVIV